MPTALVEGVQLSSKNCSMAKPLSGVVTPFLPDTADSAIVLVKAGGVQVSLRKSCIAYVVFVMFALLFVLLISRSVDFLRVSGRVKTSGKKGLGAQLSLMNAAIDGVVTNRVCNGSRSASV